MASRACFIDFEVEPSGVQKNPQKTIRSVQGAYKTSGLQRVQQAYVLPSTNDWSGGIIDPLKRSLPVYEERVLGQGLLRMKGAEVLARPAFIPREGSGRDPGSKIEDVRDAVDLAVRMRIANREVHSEGQRVIGDEPEPDTRSK